MSRKVLISALFLSSISFQCTFAERLPVQKSDYRSDLDEGVDFYQSRYNTTEVGQKITDNRGNGQDDLYGTRNMRTVLKGVLYRGGANNYFHRTTPRNNMNPLPEDGLQNLCKEGFSSAIYLYSTRFETASEKSNCDRRFGGTNELKYWNYLPLEKDQVKEIFAIVHKQIQHYSGPVYMHCWNGWHASGYASATSLMQFCGYSAEKAVAYWDANTDGNNTDAGYERIRQRIRNFQPYPEFQIPPKIQRQICFPD